MTDWAPISRGDIRLVAEGVIRGHEPGGTGCRHCEPYNPRQTCRMLVWARAELAALDRP